VARRTRQTLQSESGDAASRRQDSETGRLRRLIASCGIERWDQRAAELAAVLRKHPVVVSRWVGEASRIRSENHAFADEFDDLDRAMAKKAIERLADFRWTRRRRFIEPGCLSPHMQFSRPRMRLRILDSADAFGPFILEVDLCFD
jgi:hypothetical protein